MKLPAPFQKNLKRMPDAGLEMFFEHLIIGPFHLSVQGSAHNYCEPRKTFFSGESYRKMEVALFVEGFRGRGSLWVQPWGHPALRKWAERLGFEEGNTSVAGYVPTDTIQAFINYLTARSKDGRFVGGVRRVATAKRRKRGESMFKPRCPKKAIEHRRRLAKEGKPWSRWGF